MNFLSSKNSILHKIEFTKKNYKITLLNRLRYVKKWFIVFIKKSNKNSIDNINFIPDEMKRNSIIQNNLNKQITVGYFSLKVKIRNKRCRYNIVSLIYTRNQ